MINEAIKLPDEIVEPFRKSGMSINGFHVSAFAHSYDMAQDQISELEREITKLKAGPDDAETKEAYLSFLDGNRAPWVERRLAAAYASEFTKRKDLAERLQIAEQTIEVKQPGFDMYYHELFRKERARSLTAEKELNNANTQYLLVRKTAHQFEESLAEARKEIERYKESADQAFCVYCGFIGKRQSDEMIKHVMSCEKNPWGALCKSLNIEKMLADVKTFEARAETSAVRETELVKFVEEASNLGFGAPISSLVRIHDRAAELLTAPKSEALLKLQAEMKAEGLREAAKLRCQDCKDGLPTKRGDDGRLLHIHDAATNDVWGCTAEDISDLADKFEIEAAGAR